jgi:SAM-dependent methyltransferase
MPEEFDEAYWESRYAGHTGQAHVAPNPHLLLQAEGLTPGTALDAGCGEGGSALWLAGRGWRVTGVDVSATALRRARAHAERLGGDVAERIDWRAADLTTWEPPLAHFDLVTAHYVHPTGSQEDLVRRLAAAVAPGGTLLVVDHGPGDEHAHTHSSADALAGALDTRVWTVEVAEASAGDTVLRARRRT